MPDSSATAHQQLRRRAFLALSGASAAAITFGIKAPASAEIIGRAAPADPFTLGVASGDPSPDSVVLWTRLAPDPLAPDGHGGMPRRRYSVHFEVATDERFRQIVRRGHVLASPELAHAVHAEADGLEPDREYFYRFRTGNQFSPAGRTRTAPAPDSMPTELRFASVSCQAWYHGHFTAYEHLIAEDPQLVLFLGDYIYEYAINESNLWRSGASVAPEHNLLVETLEQFRLRYSLFKTDELLQAAHAAAPWVVTTDDHEVENNYADAHSTGGTPPDLFLRKRAVAYRACYENTPMRVVSLPEGPALPHYRRLGWGCLAQFDILDTRQFRDPYPCGQVFDNCPEKDDPERSIMGMDQENWLHDGLRDSHALWNVLAQQVVVARIDRDLGDDELFSMDAWDGFTASRDRLFDAFDRYDIANPVVLSGDIHRGVAADLKADFTDSASPTVGVELISTSVASNGDGSDSDSLEPIWKDNNEHVKLYNARRGYVSCHLTPDALTSHFRTMDYVEEPGSPISTVASFVTEAGNPGLQES